MVNGSINGRSFLRIRLDLAPLRSVFAGYAELAQQRWLAWLRKNRLESSTPTDFSAVLDLVQVFADPVIVAEIAE
jgi:hypothetical protein